ncbi:MAG TPA: hypothetical protein VH210_10400 [Gaiellaceae bacterium]|jgi:hypothetical protein|nr:hypothetical protein [Gaiellaceae bacterium]
MTTTESTEMTATSMKELAYRMVDGLEVTLFWQPASDDVVVCVCDQKYGAYFEIRPPQDCALDAFYHPYSYASWNEVGYEDERLAV